MAEWSKNKVESSAINGGNEFTTDDVLAVNELNATVNNSFYAVDFVEAMADAPDVSEIDGTGTPSVSFVSNIKNGKVFKKFKFSNLRGEKGLQGDKGDTGDKGDKGDKGDPNTLTIGSVSSGETASATITGTAPNQVLNLVLPKGEKGDKGDTGNISSLDTELSDTSTNAVQNKVIKTALDEKLSLVYDSGRVGFSSGFTVEALSETSTIYSWGFRSKVSIPKATLISAGVWEGTEFAEINKLHIWMSSSSTNMIGIGYLVDIPKVFSSSLYEICFPVCASVYTNDTQFSESSRIQLVTILAHNNMPNVEILFTGTQSPKYLEFRLKKYDKGV